MVLTVPIVNVGQLNAILKDTPELQLFLSLLAKLCPMYFFQFCIFNNKSSKQIDIIKLFDF